MTGTPAFLTGQTTNLVGPPDYTRTTTPADVIVGVGDPPETPYVLGPPGTRDMVVVRYVSTAGELTDDLARADFGTQTAPARGRRGGRRGHDADGSKGPGAPSAQPAPPPPEETWVPGEKFGDRKCRDGVACTYPQCGFAHPLAWHAARAPDKGKPAKGHLTPDDRSPDATKGRKKGGKHIMGPDEIEDRSFHRIDGVTGQPIGRRRQQEALAREQFFGTTIDADGKEIIDDGDGSDF